MNEVRRRFKPRHRVRPLLGRFEIVDAALTAAERLLPTFRGVDGDHEGIVFLFGRELGERTIYTTVIAPEADHGWGHVHCSHEQIHAVVREGRRLGLALLAQLHSHPGSWTEHSEGDDDMIVMPFDGMLSIVAPHYGGHGLRPLDSLGVHQFQGGEWVLCERDSVHAQFAIVPAEVDLR